MKLPVDLAGLARFILSDRCQSIVILTGAGVSCSSGIPDFRSPGGMYDTLRPDLITAASEEREAMRKDPTAVVEKSMFMRNSLPYLEVRRPFILGTREKKWKATLAHRFVELLHKNTGKLTRLYTQNIDGLDYQCKDLPPEKIVAVHGSIGKASCESCGAPVNFDEFCDEVKCCIKDIYGQDKTAPKQSSPIVCKCCNKPTVKPSTVLFGASLPTTFFDRSEDDTKSADLLIVAGTSLVASPANFLVQMVPLTSMRVIVNMDPVGQHLNAIFSLRLLAMKCSLS